MLGRLIKESRRNLESAPKGLHMPVPGTLSIMTEGWNGFVPGQKVEDQGRTLNVESVLVNETTGGILIDEGNGGPLRVVDNIRYRVPRSVLRESRFPQLLSYSDDTRQR